MLWLQAAEKRGRSRQIQVQKLLENEGWFTYDGGQIFLGLEWRHGAWIPQIKIVSLYQAFVAMLRLDISARDLTILRCANPECGKLFTTEKRNKIYCDSVCAALVTKRRWWRKHGPRWRRMHRKRAKSACRRSGLKLEAYT